MTSFKQTTFAATVVACAAMMIACDGRRGKMEEATFRVETASLEKTEVKKIDSYGLPEAKEFTLKACFADAASLSPVAISNFTISDGKSSKSAIADKDGCIMWKEIHHFSALQKQKSLKMDRTFRSEKLYSGAVTVSFSFNPWQETLVDLRKSNDPDLEASEQSVVGFDMTSQETIEALGGLGDIFSSAAMADVKLVFNGYDDRKTVITNLLTLKPAQRFRLSLKPQFLQRNIKNEESYVDLKGGKFKIRLVVLGEDLYGQPKAADVVAHSDSEIDVRPTGLAQKDVVVQVHDVASVLSRNQFFLIMEPMGSVSKLVRPGVYKGFVGPLAGNDASIDLIPYEGDVNEFITSVASAIDNLNSSVQTMDLIASVSGMKEEGANSSLLKFAEGNVKPESALSMIREFCSKVYSAEQTVQIKQKVGWIGRERTSTIKSRDACMQSPAQFLQIERRDVVLEVLGQPRYRPDLYSVKDIELSRGLTYTKSQGTENKKENGTSYGYSGGAGLDALALFKMIPVVGSVITYVQQFIGLEFGMKASIGGSWAKSNGLKKGETVDLGATISENEKLSVASVGFETDVRTKKCAFLSPLAESNMKGFYACSADAKDGVATERYYQVNHSVQNSVFADALSARSSMWRVLIRGKANYEAFENLMTKENGVLEFSDLEIKDPKAALLPDFKINQSFPGVLSAQ